MSGVSLVPNHRRHPAIGDCIGSLHDFPSVFLGIDSALHNAGSLWVLRGQKQLIGLEEGLGAREGLGTRLAAISLTVPITADNTACVHYHFCGESVAQRCLYGGLSCWAP